MTLIRHIKMNKTKSERKSEEGKKRAAIGGGYSKTRTFKHGLPELALWRPKIIQQLATTPSPARKIIIIQSL